MFSVESIIVIVALLGVVAYLIHSRNRGSDVLNQNINEMKTSFLDQMSLLTNQVNERMKDHNETGKKLEDRLNNAAKSYSDDIGKDISKLQELLSAPKIRGNLGELFLTDLLAQIFPADSYELQYRFKRGETIDAVVKLRDNLLVPVDAKFPLENFTKMLGAESDEDKVKYKKVFLKDVKKHVDDIAKKYILPDEGTLDFALMYIPAENVYYEALINDDANVGIAGYAMDKRVIPVSPNTFYIYLQTILLGLRGMQIEQNAKEIQANLKRLHGDLSRFGDDFDVLGTHLGNASKKYTESEKRLFAFQSKLAEIDNEVDPPVEKLSEG